MSTIAELLLDRADDDRTAFVHETGRWSFREVVAEGERRAALFQELHDPGQPPHIGLLLDNTPDYLFWLAGAALAGAVVVGINSTYRGGPLKQLIEHTDCQVLVTSSGHLDLLEGVGSPVAAERTLVIDSPAYASQLASVADFASPATAISEDDLYLLIFTSGSTGMPKAVRCTQGRMARSGAHVATITEQRDGDAVYAPLPMFHTASLFTGWASTLSAGTAFATRTRFSASKTASDIREFNATVLAYTGKVLNYILAVPEQPGDHDVPLRLAIGNEASEHDIKDFSRRFGCAVRDSYGSTEGVIIIRRDATMPPGALGLAAESVKVLDPETGEECPRATLDEAGRVVNLEAATGEIVETQPTAGFEGYYKNEAAANERFRDGTYWSGDLAYRNLDGWFFFAGRSNEWLRVDGENFAAAPVEAIVGRHPDVRSVAIYAVPDEVGDSVMAALELRDGAQLDPAAFDAFLQSQPDMGPKWLPRFVRVDSELPKLSSMKLDKRRLRREAWTIDGVLWRSTRGESLRPLDDEARQRLAPLLD